jgi:CheY-like chemotaxis protein
MTETVFVVDDDPAIREIFTAFLKMKGYTAIAVSGGRECLELLKTFNPDLILPDLMMETIAHGWMGNTPCNPVPSGNRAGPRDDRHREQPVPTDILQ